MAAPLDRTRRLLLVAAAALVGTAAAVGLLQERSRASRAEAAALTGGHPERGLALLPAYCCTGCQIIPGAGRGLAGPPLTGMVDGLYIGGVPVNTPANLVARIVNPPPHDARTAMPDTGISESDARDAASYLYLSH